MSRISISRNRAKAVAINQLQIIILHALVKQPRGESIFLFYLLIVHVKFCRWYGLPQFYLRPLYKPLWSWGSLIRQDLETGKAQSLSLRRLFLKAFDLSDTSICYPCFSMSPFAHHSKAVDFRDPVPAECWKYSRNARSC